jgi:hypothetical protein
MSFKFRFSLVVTALALMTVSASSSIGAQGNAANAKSLRCTFPLNATGTWNATGSPNAVVKETKLVLIFDSINTDEGSAELKNGSVGTGITVQLAGGNLHFIQAFRSGPLYVTTVFDKEPSGGKLKAVHSRHEYLRVPLEGATSSPEQYYGECEITK